MRTNYQGPIVVANQPSASKCTYAGLFSITLATLTYEILLTRIFSVTMWYHFAFVAISVAMFGMTLGALRVYVSPDYFTEKRTQHHMALSALLFSISILISFLAHANLPFFFEISFRGFESIVLTYSLFSIPFLFSGICVCLALTRFPRSISRLYAVDLIGASVGCILLIYMLRITDASTAVVIVAIIAALGSLFFAIPTEFSAVKPLAVAVCIGLFCFSLVNSRLVLHQKGLIRLHWVKGQEESVPLYERWNSFSRVTVNGDPAKPTTPYGWGLSAACPAGPGVRQLLLTIDASALTVLTHFDGDSGKLNYLRCDVTNIVHYIRPDSRVLIVGAGGGRDVLSSLLFRQRQVVAVEINPAILDATNNTFGDFTGHLDRLPQVKFVNDEARSYITRQKQNFDIIQISLVDTFAATAAGALVLTENSLYTVQAWKIFLDHLTPHGTLSVSRWYSQNMPYEQYRITSLASAALRQEGIQDPRKHIIDVAVVPRNEAGEPLNGIGTVLVSREPFSSQDLDQVEAVARRLKFQILLSPRYSFDSTLALLASSIDTQSSLANLPVNLTPPTDDKPFFFYWTRLRDVLHPQSWRTLRHSKQSNWSAVFLLGSLLAFVVVLTLLSIIVPLILRKPIETPSHTWPMLTFFAAIGLGFMLIEISQMQRLMIFLGHPVYAMSVVLFALLLSSGLGSYFTRSVSGNFRGQGFLRLGGLLLILVLFGLVTVPLLGRFAGSETPIRILVAVGILLPLGFMMGMPFPLGLKQASTDSPSLTPWLWGVNGAASVCASVLAVAIALSFGISTSFWSGLGCYVLAFTAFLWACRKEQFAGKNAFNSQVDEKSPSSRAASLNSG